MIVGTKADQAYGGSVKSATKTPPTAGAGIMEELGLKAVSTVWHKFQRSRVTGMPRCTESHLAATYPDRHRNIQSLLLPHLPEWDWEQI